MVTLYKWALITRFGHPDYVALYGNMFGHPSIEGSPSTFISFNRETLTGIGKSGKEYKLDATGFEPNGNARTMELALDWIEKNWVKQNA